MTRESPGPNWSGLLWESRGFLGLDDYAPVPLDELWKRAEANGWSEREFRDAHRDSDRLVNVGTLDEPAVVVDGSREDTCREEPDIEDDTLGINGGKSATAGAHIGESQLDVEIDRAPETEPGVYQRT